MVRKRKSCDKIKMFSSCGCACAAEKGGCVHVAACCCCCCWVVRCGVCFSCVSECLCVLLWMHRYVSVTIKGNKLMYVPICWNETIWSCIGRRMKNVEFFCILFVSMPFFRVVLYWLLTIWKIYWLFNRSHTTTFLTFTQYRCRFCTQRRLTTDNTHHNKYTIVDRQLNLFSILELIPIQLN